MDGQNLFQKKKEKEKEKMNIKIYSRALHIYPFKQQKRATLLATQDLPLNLLYRKDIINL